MTKASTASSSTSSTSSGVERNIILTQRVLASLLVIVILVPFLTSWWIRTQYPVVNQLSIKNISIIGDSNVCPGDLLVWSYDFESLGSGTVARDRTLWYVDPPRTKVFSEREYIILPHAISQHLVESYQIPKTYKNPETAKMEPLPSGQYKRLVSITAAGGRSGVTAIGEVDFVIKESCEGVKPHD